VDATDEAAVQRLRQRKNREGKPLALMLPDLPTAKEIVHISDAEAQLLASPQRPIVLLLKKADIPIAPSVAPQNKRLGIMLPYTPLHYLIFDLLREQAPHKFPALVMTSANRSEEPIVIENDDARQRLRDIADLLLLHNRPILVRADDSVVARFANQTVFFRRSRGYVPRPVFLNDQAPGVLAVGGELKNTICLTKGNRAFLSQHIGDLENVRAFDFFEQTIAHFQDILQTRPEAIACDLHPGYFSTQWAERQTGVPIFKVQHHHAHLASVLAEWQTDEPAIGIILDGTGYGYDGTIWGGEILIGDLTQVRRFAYLEPMPLPGGDAAIKQPWRTALGYLYKTFGDELPDLPFLRGRPVRLIQEMIDKNLNSPLTSSCGRLFDAVSVISGGRTEIHYEAQAAIEFMQAVPPTSPKPLDYEIAVPEIPLKPIIRSVTQQALSGLGFAELAARFHRTLGLLLAEVAQQARQQSGLQKIVLSGGVFQNEVLFSFLLNELKRRGFQVLTHRQVPPNDGGLALGQAAIARALLQRGRERVEWNEG
jgi:hydrogenase maturation protein HypF